MGASAVSIDRPYDLSDNATDRVRIHVRVAAGALLAFFAPCAGLSNRVAQFLIFGDGFLQVVDRHAQVLDALAVSPEVVRVQVGRIDRWNDPFVSELGVPLPANIEVQPERLAVVAGVFARTGVRLGHGRKAELLPICRGPFGLANYETDVRYFSRRPGRRRPTRPVDQAQDVLALTLRIEVSQGDWARIAFDGHLLKHAYAEPTHPLNLFRHVFDGRHLMDEGENSITVTYQEIRESVITLSWLQHVHGQIAEAARGAPGFNGYGLAAVLPFESEVAMLTDVGKTELGPALQWVVQGLRQPGDTVNSLIEFRKLGRASAGDDAAHNKTA